LALALHAGTRRFPRRTACTRCRAHFWPALRRPGCADQMRL